MKNNFWFLCSLVPVARHYELLVLFTMNATEFFPFFRLIYTNTYFYWNEWYQDTPFVKISASIFSVAQKTNCYSSIFYLLKNDSNIYICTYIWYIYMVYVSAVNVFVYFFFFLAIIFFIDVYISINLYSRFEPGFNALTAELRLIRNDFSLTTKTIIPNEKAWSELLGTVFISNSSKVYISDEENRQELKYIVVQCILSNRCIVFSSFSWKFWSGFIRREWYFKHQCILLNVDIE